MLVMHKLDGDEHNDNDFDHHQSEDQTTGKTLTMSMKRCALSIPLWHGGPPTLKWTFVAKLEEIQHDD